MKKLIKKIKQFFVKLKLKRKGIIYYDLVDLIRYTKLNETINRTESDLYSNTIQ